MDPEDEEGTRRAQEKAAEEDLSLLACPTDLGDIYIGIPYVRDRCRRSGLPLEDEVVVSILKRGPPVVTHVRAVRDLTPRN